MRFTFQCVAVAALVSCALLARAATHIIDGGGLHTAEGEMATAAEPGFESAYIDCEMSGATLSCFAWDGATRFAGCSTSDYNLKRMFPAVGRNALVRFSWDPNTSRCTFLEISNHNRHTGTGTTGAFRQQIPPTVDLDYRRAYGTVNSPPTDAFRHEQITCSARTDGLIECVASDANGVLATCIAQRDGPWQTLEDMRIAVNGINESSYVYFQWNNTSSLNECTSVTVDNASYNLL